MSGLKFVFLIGFLSICDAFWWGRDNRESIQLPLNPSTPLPPNLRQYPVSYIRAFAYHPVAFPQPLAPITTYQVRNQQSQRSSYPFSSSIQSLSQHQVPNTQNPQELETTQISTTPSTTSTTSTTTTTPMPTTTTSTTQSPQFSGSQPIPQSFGRVDYGAFSRSDYGQSIQRQLPQQNTNYGGFPYYNNQQYHYRYDDGSANQFSGRLINNEQNFQQYSADPVTYQFIPTSITPIAPQNSVKFVPCMCPVAVQVSPNLAEKRADESMQVVAQTTESSTTSSTQVPLMVFDDIEEEAK
ncbi:hypothetical protein ACKWTF_000628 [Chironomus riparius]